MQTRVMMMVMLVGVAAWSSGCEKQSSPTAPKSATAAPAPADQDIPKLTMGQPVKPGGLPSPSPAVPPAPATTVKTGMDGAAAPHGAAPTVPAPTVPSSPTQASFLGLTAPKPATWIEQQPSGTMRTAQYSVPGTEGRAAAELVVFYFGAGQGGSIEDNVKRWADQFKSPEGGPVEPAIEHFQADGMPVTLATLQGDYKGMGAMNYSPDHLFLGAIVEAPVGKVFIRVVGPTATVQPNRDAFLAMVHGLRNVEPAK